MKKIVMVMVCVLMFSFLGVVSFAKENGSEGVPTPYWNYASIVSADISIYGGKAHVSGQVHTYTGSSKIRMSLMLQQKVNGSWKTVASWSGSGISLCDVEKEADVVSGYDYRAVVNATIYDENGDFVETCSDTSYTKRA